ncbi:WD40-repeat-containing domain protein [Haematococcus lacustris]
MATMPGLGQQTGLAQATSFLTASWDCSVKVWSLAEGRQPWSPAGSALAAVPEVTLSEFEGGVWALAPGPVGSHLLLAGTEEGVVSCCDLRSKGSVWSQSLAQDYVGGLGMSPCGRFVVVGAADGCLSLLDVRNSGHRLAAVYTGHPLRCCLTDGRLAVAGSEAGRLHVWDVGLMSATASAHTGLTAPAPDGLYRPASLMPPAPVCSVAVQRWSSGCTDVCAVLEDGTLRVAVLPD